MTAEVRTPDVTASEAPRSDALSVLAARYPMMLVLEAGSERIEWMSEGWIHASVTQRSLVGCNLRDVVSHLPKPEQAFPIASQLREMGVVHQGRVELRADGTTPERHDVTVLPLEGAGSARRVAVIARKHAEPAKRESPDELLEALPHAVLAIGRDAHVARANREAERMLGAALEGCAVAALAADATSLATLLSGCDAHEAYEIEFDARRPGDTPLACRARIAPHAGGGVVLSLSPAEVGATDALARRNEELEHCINSLAHDLRSPLVALLGFSRLLRQDYGDRLDDTGAHFVDRIEQAGRTMEGLIHDALELSRIGQAGEHPAQIDPRGVLVQLAAEFKARLEEDRIGLVLPDAPPPVYCDRTRLYQVFCNLIGNAIDHMGEGSDARIEVEVSDEEGFHHICVRDHGRGIDAEQHERIFEAFQSLGARRDGRKGTGMGLAIVRKIAETRGGRAWVESTPGNGAAFHVTLARQ